MPIRAPQPCRPPLTEWQLYQLCSGSVFFPDVALSATDLPYAWRSVRDAVLARYAERCPGCRPHAWWLLEAPEPRRCLVGAHDCPQRAKILRGEKQGQLYYGVPGVYCCPRCWAECYESQGRYLRRLERLLPAEDPIIPRDLRGCDRWTVAQYGDEDHPSPWASGRKLEGCRTLLDAWHEPRRG